MVVKKILNNNVVTSEDEKGQEMIVMGNGLGWKLKVGSKIDETKIEKIFRMDTDTSTNQLKRLFMEVKEESIKASMEIIEYAKKTLEKELKKNIYITLTDHIDFAVERFHKGIKFDTPLYWEIRKIYPKEFAAGECALKIINKYFKIEMPEAEATSIALHLINAEYDGDMTRTQNMIDMVNDSMNIVCRFMRINMNTESLDYQRFLTHLLFFAQRILDNKKLDSQDDFLYEMMKERYQKELKCAEKIAEFIKLRYGAVIEQEEIIFLTVHIARVSKHQD